MTIDQRNDLRAEGANEAAICRNKAQMTPRQLMIGCSVIVAATVGGLISSNIVNRHIPAGSDSRTVNQTQTTSHAEKLENGFCFTLAGKKFEWHWANVPFAAVTCSQ
jgi:hypothetical protein